MMATDKRMTDFFAPRPKSWRHAELRHARLVAGLRVALPVTALLLLAAVFIWPIADGHKLIAMPPAPTGPLLTMDNPRYTGTDEQNRPYTLAAQQAQQQPHDLMQIDLTAPQAQLSGSDGQPLNGSAARGRFDQAKKRLWLGGNVQLTQGTADTALHFATSELFADLAQHTVWGDKPAQLTGPFGSIEGQGFRIYDGGKVLLFTGASRAILTGKGSLDLPAPTLDKQAKP